MTVTPDVAGVKEAALRLFESLFPGKQIVGVPAEFLVVGLGSLHCLSQQQPAVG